MPIGKLQSNADRGIVTTGRALGFQDQEVGCSNHLTPTSWQYRKFCTAFLFEPRGSVWGRLRAPPVAEEASKKEWHIECL